ncbi:MAG: four helix bundle protein [Ignavibacteriaceae bacterium]|nr:four helix bundle protein [Ignavibacteriaceae bacterium]
MKEEKNNLYNKALQFAVRMVKLREYFAEKRREHILSKQILRSGTSIGANIAEANASVSRVDFTNKLAIALKEANETKFWLQLLHATEYLSNEQYESLYKDADELCKILYTLIKKNRKFKKS